MADIRTAAATESDPYAVTDAQAGWVERIAELLDDGLPADWRDRAAIEARQDHLAALGHLEGEHAIDVLGHLAELRQQGMPLEPDDPVVRAFASEMVGLERALSGYVGLTQRSDGVAVVRAAVAFSAGEGVADFVMAVLARGGLTA